LPAEERWLSRNETADFGAGLGFLQLDIPNSGFDCETFEIQFRESGRGKSFDNIATAYLAFSMEFVSATDGYSIHR
jgi:hypothetical protein